MKQIKNYDGLYGDINPNKNSNFVFLELISTRSQEFNWKIESHLHNHLFQVFFIENGELEFTNNLIKTAIEAPCIIFIPPNHLHGLHYSPRIKGKILTISESIIEDIFPTSSLIWNCTEKNHILPCSLDEYQKYDNFLNKISKELFSDNLDHKILLKAYLIELIVEISRTLETENDKKNDNLVLSYFRKFQKIIKFSKGKKSIALIAEEIGISTVHLNRICKAVSGFNATQLIQNLQINEAKKYLQHSSYSVSEIAYLLNFNYPNYFARLFKKITGLSPVEYRALSR